MSSMVARDWSLTLTVRSNTFPPSLTCDTTFPASATLTNSENWGIVMPYLASMSRLGWICSCGRSICCSRVRSAMPSMPWIEFLIWLPRLNNLFKSGPKSLMAMFACVPDSMASIRWEMGCPISMLAPLMVPSFARTAARNSSRLRSFSSKGASISEVLTPSACSSSSARPVLRATVWTSGNSISICSASRPILSDSSKETPGMVLTLIVKEPSLNGGRKLRPCMHNKAMETTSNTLAVPITNFLWRSAQPKACR